MGESKRKKTNSKADKLSSEFFQGQAVSGMDDFIEHLVGHADRNSSAMSRMTASGQARHMREVFEHSHLVFALWRTPRGLEVLPVKGEEADLVEMLAGGDTVVMMSAFWREDHDEAESLGAMWELTSSDRMRGNSMARDMWEMMTPAMRPTLQAHVKGMEERGLFRTA